MVSFRRARTRSFRVAVVAGHGVDLETLRLSSGGEISVAVSASHGRVLRPSGAGWGLRAGVT
jgi:hypothetical protein